MKERPAEVRGSTMELKKMLKDLLKDSYKTKTCEACNNEFDAELGVGFHPGRKLVIIKSKRFCKKCRRENKFRNLIVDIESEIPDYSSAEEKAEEKLKNQVEVSFGETDK